MDKPKKKNLIRFLMLLGVFLAYFGYLSWKYDIVTGGLVAVLTWSFFVLCTPVADAGFLLDFPVRLITGLPMILSELGVWTIAITTNISVLLFSPESYDKSFLTHLLHKILTHPWPYWAIIVLCAAGTYLSVWLGDEVMDAVSAHHKGKGNSLRHQAGKWKWPLTTLLFGTIAIVYYFLLRSLGIDFGDLESHA